MWILWVLCYLAVGVVFAGIDKSSLGSAGRYKDSDMLPLIFLWPLFLFLLICIAATDKAAEAVHFNSYP